MTENTEDLDSSAVEEEEKAQKPKTNYKGWAFRFFVYSLITQVTVFLFTIALLPGLHDPTAYQKRLAIFGIIALITLIAALFMLVLSYTNGESPSLKRKIALFGIITLGLFEAITKLLAISDYLI